MFLKRVILHGFKSFADRTEFDFGPGITGIVGPNGCGKSNVLDAVRWVLGEQSAKTLRGSRMADVIFAGSRSRKPANAAEVQLIFDNRARFLDRDQDEVAVARVLYRNGESEYRINGEQSRLKDVRSLLLDTGVGVDAYSVIAQGRVDVLLQSNPVERREIFEEAAGVSRYKVQRGEAQRKLERAEQNLLRLNDVLDELEKRLRSVRLAAGKARNYLEYDGRLRELRSAFALAEFHGLQESAAALRNEARELEELLLAKRTELAGQDAQAAECEQRVRGLDERIQALEQRLREWQQEAGTQRERIEQTQRRIEEGRAARLTQQQEEQQAAARADELNQRLESERAALGQLSADAEEAEARAAKLRGARQDAEKSSAGSRQSLERARSAAFEAARRAALLQNEKAGLEQQRRRYQEQIEALRLRRTVVERELGEAQQNSTALSARREQVEGLLRELQEQRAALEERAAALDAALRQIGRELAEVREQRSGLLSRLGVLEDMDARLEGVNEATRAVLAWREGRPAAGVVGLVADLLRIDDARVRLLQPVLRRIEKCVVVEGAADFSAAVEESGLQGAVEAMALDRLGLERGLPVVEGDVVRASDLVVCDAAWKPLAERLLGSVFLTPSRLAALELAAAREGVFISPDGLAVASDGRISAGPHAASAGLMSRKADIRQLQGAVDDVETRLEQGQRRLAEIEGHISDVQLQSSGLLTRIGAAQREEAELRLAAQRVADDAARAQRELDVIASEAAEFARATAEIERRGVEVEDERSVAASDENTRQGEIQALESELGALEQTLGELTREMTEALVVAGRAAERRSAALRGLEELQNQAADLARKRGALADAARTAQARLEAAEIELEQAYAAQTRAETEIRAAEEAALELRGERQAARQQIEQCGAAVRELHGEIEAVDAALHECNAKLREGEVRRESLVTRVREELGVELAAVYEQYEHADQDWDAIRAEIDELRGRIARLGNVNLDAIAELEELAPRNEAMVAQRADLVASIERLRALIEQLDNESQARFAASFVQIRENFQELFRKLFGGGKADIILEDESKPLECGIEIVARPPGKEPQSISLLSGGEKTMTAVALLLAVFKSKPSPFAILDEVDAALDEANTERFNNLIQEFLTHSQFIVITHSKRTMHSADVLYGVTMEEPGVSKRVSVRFDESVQTPRVA